MKSPLNHQNPDSVASISIVNPTKSSTFLAQFQVLLLKYQISMNSPWNHQPFSDFPWYVPLDFAAKATSSWSGFERSLFRASSPGFIPSQQSTGTMNIINGNSWINGSCAIFIGLNRLGSFLEFRFVPWKLSDHGKCMGQWRSNESWNFMAHEAIGVPP